VDEAVVNRLRQAGRLGPNTGVFRFKVIEAGRDSLTVRVFEKGSWLYRDFAVTLDVDPVGAEAPARQEAGKGKTERTPAELIRGATTAPDGREEYPVLPVLSTPMRRQVAYEITGSDAVRAAYAKLDAARERNVTWFDGVRELEQQKAVWCLASCLCHPSPDVQIHALRALKSLGDRRAVPLLVLYAEYMAVVVSGSENATIHGIIHTETARTLSALTGVRVELRGQDAEGLERGARLWRRWLADQNK
jgi:hypothetical protein